jgi:hypothetical protein
MYNWDINEEKLKKDSDVYRIWKIEQLVNYSLGLEKINEKELREYWLNLEIDPMRRSFLSLALNGG